VIQLLHRVQPRSTHRIMRTSELSTPESAAGNHIDGVVIDCLVETQRAGQWVRMSAPAIAAATISRRADDLVCMILVSGVHLFVSNGFARWACFVGRVVSCRDAIVGLIRRVDLSNRLLKFLRIAMRHYLVAIARPRGRAVG